MSVKQIQGFCVLLGICTLLVCGYCFFQLRSVYVVAPESPPMTLVIDAGHGGEDGGCVGIDGQSESAVNLSISLRLRDLAVFCGADVKMIRETDTSVYDPGCRSIAQKKVSDIRNRTKFVNQTQNAVLVSIHQNYFPQNKYHGAQVFYAKTGGSEAFAENMQAALRAGIDPQNNRLAKPAKSVYLMEHVFCPAILVECGFLSNEQEAKELLKADYQKKLSCVICAETIRFITAEEYNREI